MPPSAADSVFGSNLDTPRFGCSQLRFGRAGYHDRLARRVSRPCVSRSFRWGGWVQTGGFISIEAANRRELAVERAAKKDAVEALNGVFKTTGVAVVAHYSGLTVEVGS